MAKVKHAAPWRHIVGVPLSLALSGVVLAVLTYKTPAAQLMAFVGVGLGLLAAMVGLLGIALAWHLARRARESRATLVSSFDALQRRLPTLLSIQLILCGLTVAAGVATFLVQGVKTHDYRLATIMALVLPTVAVMIWVAVSSARAESARYMPVPLSVLGCQLRREVAPVLWADVDAMSDELGAPRVDNIISGILDGFFVTSGAVYGGAEGTLTGHTLYVSAAQLPLLDRVQLRCIVAHELAHFRGEDTLYTQRFAPIYHGFGRRIADLAEYDYGDWVGKVFLRPGWMLAAYGHDRFLVTVKHWSRLREHEADLAAASVVGARPFAVSLVRAILLQTRLDTVLARADDSQADNVIDALYNDVTTTPLEDLGGQQLAHPYDSHPLLAERLDRLGVSFDATLLAEAVALPTTRASASVNDWSDVSCTLSNDLREAMKRHRAKNLFTPT